MEGNNIMNQFRDEAGMRHQPWPDHYNDYDRLLYVASQHGFSLETVAGAVDHMDDDVNHFHNVLQSRWRSTYESRVCWDPPPPYTGWRLHKVLDVHKGVATLSGGDRVDAPSGAKFGGIYAIRRDIDGSMLHYVFLDNVVMRAAVPMRELVSVLHDEMLSTTEVMSLDQAKECTVEFCSHRPGTFFPDDCIKLALEAAAHQMVTSYVLNAFEGDLELTGSLDQAMTFDRMRGDINKPSKAPDRTE